METLWENGQYGTSRNYRRALNSFSTFLDGNDIPFSSLDSALACRYEAWLWQQRVARNSSSFYMRILRAVYNKAVKQGIAVQTFPFREVYTGVARTSKRAVDEETILKLQGLTSRIHRLWHFPGTCSCSAIVPVAWRLWTWHI